MRCFDRHRRRLIKRHYTFGTIKSASGTSKVEIQDSEGLPFEKIEITGSTQQDKFEGNVDEIVSLSAYEANIEDGVAGAYSNILRSAELITLPDGVESANIFLEEVSSLLEVVPEYITILSVNEALNSFKVLYSMNQIFESTETEPFYIAIADETGNNSDNNTYYSALINNCNLVIRHHLESTVPTPETPIPIENVNDNGTSVVLHGTNLCDYNIIKKSVWSHQIVEVYDEVAGKTRNCIAYNCAGRQMVIEGGFKENTQYTVSYWTASQPTATNVGRPFCFWYTDGTFSYGGYKSTTDYNFTRIRITSTAGKTVSAVGVPNFDNNSKVYVDIDTFLLCEGAIADPVYEPYFRETVEIPTSVTYTSTEGTNKTVPLLFSKHDKLLVDRINNKVIYSQGSWFSTLTGTENWVYNAYANSTFGMKCYQNSKPYPTICVSLSGNDLTVLNCNYFKTDVWSASMMQTGDYTCTLTENYTLIFRFTGTEDVSVFKEFLQSKYAEGNPVTVLAKRKTPVEHDITNTDLGKALLGLRLPRGQDGMLCVNSNTEVSRLDVSYYSLEDEDKVLLTVCYVNNEGEEIKGTSSYDVRKGSKYQVIAPHIDGYKCQFNELYGVAEEDTTVVLTYEEATEDVSI